MEFDIIGSIVLYNNDPKLVFQVISSFLSTELRVKLILVDNSPSDKLKSLDTEDRIEYIFNDANIGFGAAHNIAIKKYRDKCTYFAVLNPDIYFGEGTQESILEFMDSHKEVGHLMPKILYPNEENQYLCKKNPSITDLFLRRFAPSFVKKWFRKSMDEYEYRDHDYDSLIWDVPYFSGCYMFFRSSTLKEVGFFDDRIFMYIEDADITRRFLQVSRTVYFPGATVYHHFAKGSHTNWRLMWYSIHGAFIYFFKWGFWGK